MVLQGKVAIVTGVDSEVGAACVLELAREGATVVAVGESPSALANFSHPGGHVVTGQTCRITRREEVDRLVGWVVRTCGELHIVVNAPRADDREIRLEECPLQVVEDQIKLRFYGPLNVMQASFPYLREVGSSSIINFSDPDAAIGEPGRMASNASNEAVAALSRTAAREWGRFGVRVNVVRSTDCAASGDGSAAEADPWVLSQIPLGRMGSSREIARTVVFLASEEAAMLAGMTVEVDGGRSMFA